LIATQAEESKTPERLESIQQFAAKMAQLAAGLNFDATAYTCAFARGAREPVTLHWTLLYILDMDASQLNYMTRKQLQAVMANLHKAEADVSAELSSKFADHDDLVAAIATLLDESRMRGGFARPNCAAGFAALGGQAK
jgi:hypothetical protein